MGQTTYQLVQDVFHQQIFPDFTKVLAMKSVTQNTQTAKTTQNSCSFFRVVNSKSCNLAWWFFGGKKANVAEAMADSMFFFLFYSCVYKKCTLRIFI